MALSPFRRVLFPLLLTLATGCSHNTTAPHPAPPALAQLALSDIALFFHANVGQTSRAQTVTLTNMGTATLALSSITLSDTTNFAMTSTCGSTLAASANCSLTITFKPQSATDLHVTISLANNAPSSPQTIRINGTSGTSSAPAKSVSSTPTSNPQLTRR